MSDQPDAFDAAKAAAKESPVLGHITYADVEYPLIKRPNALLLAELSRLESDDPEAMGTLVDFFIETMGKSTYKAFRKAFFAQEFGEVTESVENLALVVQDIVTVTMGRPTEPSRN